MIVTKVVDIMHMSLDEVFALVPGIYNVHFQDGSMLPMLHVEIQVNWFHWSIYPRYKTTATPSPDKTWVMERQNPETGEITYHPFDGSVHLDLGQYTIFNIHDCLDSPDKPTLFNLAYDYYSAVNAVFVTSITKIGGSVTTGDFFHYDQFAKAPDVMAAMAAYDKDPNMDERPVYKAITDFAARTDVPEYHTNEIRRGIASGTINSRSICQTFGPRGKVKDTDGGTFAFPITRGYYNGLMTTYAALAESCSGKRALGMQGGPLEKSEYYNRRIRLATGAVSSVRTFNCGSTNYIRWPVREHDIPILTGSYYLKDGALVAVREGDTHLIGKVLQLRNIVSCMNEDTSSCCAICAGEAEIAISTEEILGIAMVIGPNAAITQKMLSVKHLEQSQQPAILEINHDNKRILTLNSKNKWALHLGRPPSKQKYILRIGGSEQYWLAAVKDIANVEELTPSRLGNITEISIMQHGSSGKILGLYNQDVRTVKTLRVGAHFTMEFLKYIKENGWVTNPDNSVDFDMCGWEKEWPLMHLPRVNADVRQYLETLETFLFGTAKDEDPSNKDESLDDVVSGSIESCKTRTEALMTLTDLFTPPPGTVLNADASIHISLAAVGVYVKTAMCRDPDNLDFNFPRGDEPFKFVNLRRVVKNRSLGGAFAFEGHAAIINEPATYVNINRPSSPLDPLLVG